MGTAALGVLLVFEQQPEQISVNVIDSMREVGVMGLFLNVAILCSLLISSRSMHIAFICTIMVERSDSRGTIVMHKLLISSFFSSAPGAGP